jgi:hypothetical protein
MTHIALLWATYVQMLAIAGCTASPFRCVAGNAGIGFQL